VYVLDTEEQIKLMVKFLQDVNQYVKNIYNTDGFYNYENGLIICNGKKQVTPYIVVEPIYTKKNSVLEEMIKSSSFTIIGDEFFQFHKNYKNNINKIIIDNGAIKFETDLPLVELQFNKINANNKLFSTDEYELLGNFELPEEHTSVIVDSGNNPFNLYLDFESGKATINKEPSDSYLQIIFNKKFVVGFKSTKTFTSSIKANVYDYDSDNNLYLVELIIISKDIVTKQYMVITDILIEEPQISIGE
jgi:hypothetical protein